MQSLLRITFVFGCLLVPPAQVLAQASDATPTKETESQEAKPTDAKPVEATVPETQPSVSSESESAETQPVTPRKPHARHHDGRFPGAAGAIGLDLSLIHI